MAPLRLVPSEIAFLRFVAGIRALLATLVGTVLMADKLDVPNQYLALMLAYLAWTAWLLWKTLHGWPQASARLWLWVDAATLLIASEMVAHTLPLFGISTVLPVVAMAVLAGAAPAMALAVACAVVMLATAGSLANFSSMPPLPVSVPIIVLALGPAAALLARPSRDLRLRLKLVETLNERSDPRQGLRHHVDMLLEQLSSHFGLRAATVSLQGPEPRIFQRLAGQPANELAGPEGERWRLWLAALPRDVGCIQAAEGGTLAGAVAVHLGTGVQSRALDDETRRTLERIGAQTLSIPLMNYGQPLGTLSLQRDEPAFNAADVRWLNNVMHEIMPLLERSDLLEQLQRETASRERERIGRDLHDSAVQPYLGLKYGLEALARRAGPANPISPQIDQLVGMASAELQVLRDVISGLRRGDDPHQADGAPLAALQREAQRFEALYGLKVNIFAPQALRLRGSAAKAVLHMVNEALTNARRHTSATAVTVLLDVNKSDVVLRLRNDHGQEDTLPADFLPLSLTERATELGGSVEIEHQPDFTEIMIRLPMLGAIG